MERITVLDNLINDYNHNHIEKTLLDNDKFKYQFVRDVTIKGNEQQRPGFYHMLMQDNKKVSPYADLAIDIINYACIKTDMIPKNILQARSFLQLPLAAHYRGDNVDTPHIDSVEKHIVILYYVNDSDGCTVIYDKKFEEGKTVKFDELKEIKRVEPKKGRVVIFNGLHYHTGEQPNSHVRSIINCNIQV